MIVRWTKKLGLGGWILVVVGGFALTLVMMVVGAIYLQRSRIETMLARTRAAGEPVTSAELDAMLPLIPPARDATRFWLDGFDLDGPADQKRFGELPFVGFRQPDELPLPGSEWPELALAEEFLATRVEALKRFHQAAGLGGAARLESMDDPQPLILESLRAAARLLKLESEVRAHKGQVGPTVASLQAAYAVGTACEGSPAPMSFLIQQSIEAGSTHQLLRLLPHVQFSDAQLARLQSTLRAIDHRRDLLHALLAERVSAIRALRNPALLAAKSPNAKPSPAGPLVATVAMPDYLETMNEAVGAADLPWPEALDTANEITYRVAETPVYARFGAIETPAIGFFFDAAATATARTRLADIALAAQRYRLAHGRLPEALDDLTPDFIPSVPLDPFSGEPTRYLRTADGFVVYSVGADRKDDGGHLDVEAFYTRSPDLAYRIRYPKDDSADVDQSVLQSLDLPVSFEFQETPVVDAIEFIHHYTDLDVTLEQRTLAAVKIDEFNPVTLSLRDVTVESALTFILEPLGLTHQVEGGALRIIEHPPGQRRPPEDNPVILARNAEINRVLRNKKGAIRFVDTPLVDVVAYFGDVSGINIVVDDVGLSGAGLSTDESVTASEQDVSLANALTTSLGSIGLTYIVRDEVIFITPMADAEE